MNATASNASNADRAVSGGIRGGRRAARLIRRLAGTSTGHAPARSRLRLSLLALSALLPLAATLPSSPASAAVLPAAPTVTSPAPLGVAGAGNLTFAEEFNGTALDTTTWQPGWFGSRVTAPINPDEKQCYSPRQATVSGGALHLSLVARRLTCGGVARS